MNSEQQSVAHTPVSKVSAPMSRAIPYPASSSLVLGLQRLLHLPSRVHVGFSFHAGWWILPAALLGAAFWIWVLWLIIGAF